jgi:hypothetical protein
MMNKFKTAIGTFGLLLAAVVGYAQDSAAPLKYEIVLEGEVIGSLIFDIKVGSSNKSSLTSKLTYSIDAKEYSYTANINLTNSLQLERYSMQRVAAGIRNEIRCVVDQDELNLSFFSDGRSVQEWSIEMPEEDWLIFDTNSLIGSYLVSLQIVPGVETIRGNLFLLPNREFVKYEIVSRGPTVMLVDNTPVQCDLYNLVLENSVTYQLFIRDTDLIAIKQDGTEFSIVLQQD